VLSKPSIAVAFYEAYETGSVNDAEFKAAGSVLAKTYGTLGLTPGKDSATVGQGIRVPVKNRDDVAQALTSIHQALHALAYNRAHHGLVGRREESRNSGARRAVTGRTPTKATYVVAFVGFLPRSSPG
jgi:hypothetical protein